MNTNTITILTFLLFFISIISLGITGVDIFKILEVSEKLNGDESNKALWEVIIRSVGTIGTLVLGIGIYRIFNNVRQKMILHRKNVLILKLFGLSIMLIGLVCVILINHLFPVHTIETARYYLLLIIGGCFNFFAYALKLGIQLQEEQDLTI